MKGKILVIGSTNTDMTAFCAKMPAPGETVLGNDFVMGPGGKGANQAVAAKRLGGDVKFICKVGDDIFGEDTIRHFKEEGLDTSGVMISKKPSGVALITVDESAENCIVVASGANNDYTQEDIRSCEAMIKDCDILLMQLEIPVPAVIEAAKIAHEAGKTVVLNPAPAIDLPEEIFKYISLFIPNENELEKYSGVPVEGEETAAKAAKALMDKGVGDLIVTMGSKGSLICQGEETAFVQAHKVEAVDTTGAGDCYCGALCVGLSENMSLKEAASFATKASALAVQRPGAQNAMPYRKEIV
ncbi:MAG: ribokinase [Bacteroidales bacterium]|nr:ribokinase [Bacteroidales bacterium]MBP3270483.1 ribokinase [Bacteroidales bacterium]